MEIQKENKQFGIIYRLTRFHFWVMIFFWEFEIIRVFITLRNINKAAIYLAFGTFRFDLLLLTLTIICFVFSMVHIVHYPSGGFPLMSLFSSTLLLIFITLGYFSGINNSAILVQQSILDIRNFLHKEKLPFINVEQLEIHLLISVSVLSVLLGLLSYVYYYTNARKNKSNNNNFSQLNDKL